MADVIVVCPLQPLHILDVPKSDRQAAGSDSSFGIRGNDLQLVGAIEQVEVWQFDDGLAASIEIEPVSNALLGNAINYLAVAYGHRIGRNPDSYQSEVE